MGAPRISPGDVDALARLVAFRLVLLLVVSFVAGVATGAVCC